MEDIITSIPPFAIFLGGFAAAAMLQATIG